MIAFNQPLMNQNQFSQPLIFPSLNLGMQQSPLVTVDGKMLQQPVMPLTYTMPLNTGYTPCIVDSTTGSFVPVNPMMLSPPVLSASVSPQVSPQVSPMMAPLVAPMMNLDLYNLDGNCGRESSVGAESVYSDYSETSESTIAFDDFEEQVSVQPPVTAKTASFTEEPKTKEQIVPEKLAIIQNMFVDRYDENGMRGSDIARIKVKTISALNQIVELLQYLSEHLNIIHVSCPKSTKKKGQSVRGFICYLKVAECDLERLEQMFNIFNIQDAFHPIDVNPQKKA